jgi:hypothetical protein
MAADVAERILAAARSEKDRERAASSVTLSMGFTDDVGKRRWRCTFTSDGEDHVLVRLRDGAELSVRARVCRRDPDAALASVMPCITVAVLESMRSVKYWAHAGSRGQSPHSGGQSPRSEGSRGQSPRSEGSRGQSPRSEGRDLGNPYVALEGADYSVYAADMGTFEAAVKTYVRLGLLTY